MLRAYFRRTNPARNRPLAADADTAIPASEATQLVNLARAPNSPHLQVDVVGSIAGSHLDVLVGGQTALSTDFAGQLSAKLPMFVAMVVALSFILLMILFRSLVIPATAAIMNLFSAAASFGVIVAVFQFGWLKSLVGVTHTGPITRWCRS